MKILVVEDEELLVRAIYRILSRAGYEVVVAEDGVQGKCRFDHHGDIDLVITDTDMPLMDGERMLQLLASEIERRQMPVIVMSGKPQREGLRRYPFLFKPFQKATLLELVASLIGDRG